MNLLNHQMKYFFSSPDVNSIYEHFSRTGASNINKDTICSIIPELIKQKVLENIKSAYGDCLY